MSEDKNEVFLIGEGRHGTPGALRTEDDRTLRTWGLQVAQDATGAERLVLMENDRTPRQQMILWETSTPGPVRWRAETTGEATVGNMGWGGAAMVRQLHETTGEQKNVFHGKDSGGNIDPLRTNANQQLQIEIVDGSSSTRSVLGQLDPLAATDTVLYTVPALTETEVTMFSVANRGAAAITWRMGLSAGGGALANEDYIYYDLALNPGNSFIHAAPLLLAAADEVRVYSDLATAAFAVCGKELS